MNTLTRWIMIALLALPGAVSAQFEDQPPDEQRPPPPPPPEGRPSRGGPESPMRQWMQRLKEKDPKEFERLRRLRDEDPEAFHDELGSRIRHARMVGAMRDHPGMAEAFGAMRPEERDQFLNRFAQPDKQGRPIRSRPPELEKLDREIMEQARRCREATDDAAREESKRELREKLSATFDLKEKAREADIQQMETQITRLKEKLESRRAHREEIIDQRLRNLTEDKAWDW